MRSPLFIAALFVLVGCGVSTSTYPPYTEPTPSVPAAPPRLCAAPGSSKITVNWQPVAGATSYTIYWSTSGVPTASSTAITGVNPPYEHTGLTEGQFYYYMVTTTGTNGTSATASPFAATRPSAFVSHPSYAMQLGCSPTIPTQLVNTVLVSGTTVYVGTTAGLAVSYDSGATYMIRSTTEGLAANTVLSVAISGSTVYVGTTNGLSVSTDGGLTFTVKSTVGSVEVNALAVSGSTLYLGTSTGLLVSTDNGDTVTPHTAGLSSTVVNAVAYDGSTVYAGTPDGLGILTGGVDPFALKTTGQGLGSNAVAGIVVSGSTIYAATAGGLSLSTDGGTSFTNRTMADGLGSNAVTGVFVDGTTVYASTAVGLAISTNGGTSFTSHTIDASLPATRGVNVSGGTARVATDLGVATTTDAGLTFTLAGADDGLGASTGVGGNGVARYFRSVAATATYVYALGTDFTRSLDAGVSFSAPTVGAAQGYALFVESTTLYTSAGALLQKSVDNGVNFTPSFGNMGSCFPEAVWTEGTTIYVGCDGDGVYVSTDSGVTYTPRTTVDGLGDDAVNGFFETGSSLYVATEGGVSLSTDGGVTYTNRTTADGLGSNSVRAVLGTGSTVYAATQGGLSVSTDSGTSYTNYSLLVSSVTGAGQALALDGTTLYIGTDKGLYRTVNSGPTLTRYSVTDGIADDRINGVAVDPSGVVYLATQSGLSRSAP